jgi:hypothetical protein
MSPWLSLVAACFQSRLIDTLSRYSAKRPGGADLSCGPLLLCIHHAQRLCDRSTGRSRRELASRPDE